MRNLKENELKQINAGSPGQAHYEFWGDVGDFIDGLNSGIAKGFEDGMNWWNDFAARNL